MAPRTLLTYIISIYDIHFSRRIYKQICNLTKTL
jgi:hypothetical protein